MHIWLGGLFTPEAYITATRQYVAQANNWSLEELYLDVSNAYLVKKSFFYSSYPTFFYRYMLISKEN